MNFREHSEGLIIHCQLLYNPITLSKFSTCPHFHIVKICKHEIIGQVALKKICYLAYATKGHSRLPIKSYTITWILHLNLVVYNHDRCH